MIGNPTGRGRFGAADFAWIAAFACLAFFFYRRLFFGGEVLAGYDYLHDFYPRLQWMHQRLAEGRPVLWDGSQGMGDPLFDLLCSFILYPPFHLIVSSLDAVPAVATLIVFHVFWLAAGCYTLARSRGAGPQASFAAGVLGGFGGGVAHCLDSPGMLMPLAWFPWMLWGACLIGDARRRFGPGALAGAAVLGVSTGMAFLAGHTGLALSQLYATALFHFARLALGPDRLRRLGTQLPALAAAALIAGLIFSGQARGLERAAAQNSRGAAYSQTEASDGCMNPTSLVQVFLPHLLGQPRDNTFLGMSWRWGSYEPQGVVLYVGVASTALALLGFYGEPLAESLPWLAAWLLLVLYALGDRTPVFGLILKLPLMTHFHFTVRAAAQAAPLLAVPSALGLERILEGRKGSRTTVAAAFAVGLLLLAAALALYIGGPWIEAKGKAFVEARVVGTPIHGRSAAYYFDKLSRWLTALRSHCATQGLWALATGLAFLLAAKASAWRRPWLAAAVGLVLFGELWANLEGYRETLPRAVLDTRPASAERILMDAGQGAEPFRCLEWGEAQQGRRAFPQGRYFGDLAGELRFQELLEPATQLWCGLSFVNVYPTAKPKRLAEFTGFFGDLTMDPAQPVSALLPHRRLFDLAGARYLVLAEPLEAPGLEPLMSDPVYVYRNPEALPLAYVATRWSDGWDSAAAAAALMRGPESKWERPALLEGRMSGFAGSGRGPGGTVRWLRYADEEWSLEVSASAPGVLALSRFYYPGIWKAEVAGRPTELIAANAALCALPIPRGVSRVRVWYEDQIPGQGAAAEATALGLAALLLGAAAVQYRRRGPLPH
jgi:hypothetical protein